MQIMYFLFVLEFSYKFFYYDTSNTTDNYYHTQMYLTAPIESFTSNFCLIIKFEFGLLRNELGEIY